MFGGLRADRLVSEQVLHCLTPLTIQAAIEAIKGLQGTNDDRLRHKELALEQVRYEVTRARRQYDVVDPLNRLVASELERRWNEALRAQAQLEAELALLQRERPDSLKESTEKELLALAQDVPALWDHPKSSPEHKKHILRIVLKEIIATSHGDSIHLLLHWRGGEHTQLQMQKTRTGHHRYVIATDTIELVRSLALVQPDGMIASILNRAGLRTAHGKSWTGKHVCSVRYNHSIPLYSEEDRKARCEIFVDEASVMLGLTPSVLMRLIRQKKIPATQVCRNAPWILRKVDVEKFAAAERGRGETRNTDDENQLTLEIQ
jgi:Helix-turn-helix domain